MTLMPPKTDMRIRQKKKTVFRKMQPKHDLQKTQVNEKAKHLLVWFPQTTSAFATT
jgi:hypothetical protein